MAAARFVYPFWGSEAQPVNKVLNHALNHGFEGIEINIPNNDDYKQQLQTALTPIKKQHPNFILIPQQVRAFTKESPANYLRGVLKQLDQLRSFENDFINSHTGRDYYSFSDNCKIIEAIETYALKHNLQIYHEIHRGRFTFHSTTTLPYLNKFPKLKLVGDLSHWCVVSESMLDDQEDVLNRILPHIHHIHARIGFEQAAQVNHPFAPEWTPQLNRFLKWWQQIFDIHKTKKTISITPEFGPYPYMPQTPFEQKPLAHQHELNVQMKTYLEQHLILNS